MISQLFFAASFLLLTTEAKRSSSGYYSSNQQCYDQNNQPIQCPHTKAGEIAAIVILSSLGLFLLLLCCCCCCRRRSYGQSSFSDYKATQSTASLDSLPVTTPNFRGIRSYDVDVESGSTYTDTHSDGRTTSKNKHPSLSWTSFSSKNDKIIAAPQPTHPPPYSRF
ncbi:hypothetical protein L218DRAFT_954238 [Marasmius fiardii PR-910]|nr:hypothetical protein L218DRAFT_954238 [Marasmius fiardii PR-910]